MSGDLEDVAVGLRRDKSSRSGERIRQLGLGLVPMTSLLRLEVMGHDTSNGSSRIRLGVLRRRLAFRVGISSSLRDLTMTRLRFSAGQG